jgi:hypothetical protein
MPRKPPGRCIFCDRLGVTKEHMWADWLRNFIPRELAGHATSFEKIHLRRSEKEFHRRTGDPHSRRIKCVCRPCNNEWMSELQEKAKPYLIPMLSGHEIKLRRNGQTAVASWVTMMVMVAEHLNAESVAIGPSERRRFKDNHMPPSHWRIWIGRHEAASHPLFTHNILSFATEEEIKRLGIEGAIPANTQTSTILLGKHLLIHVMSSPVARSIIRRWRLPIALAPSLTQIWPVVSGQVIWPPRDGILLDSAIDLLAQEFASKAGLLAQEIAFSRCGFCE